MTNLLFSLIFVCGGSLVLGQCILRLCGAGAWSWLAPAVGFSALMLLALPATLLPGRSLTVAVVTAALIVAGAYWLARSPDHRPPLGGITAPCLVALLVLLPFLAAGRVGTLGLITDNDMATHLQLALAICCSSRHGLGFYPLGPHAVAAELSSLGVRLDRAFAGVTIAAPILIGWTSQMVLGRERWPARVLVATVTGLPFLMAAYVGQGSFKEPIEALFVLASALLLAGYGSLQGRLRWVPFGLLLAGTLSVYSVTGLVWPLVFGAVALGAHMVSAARRHRLRAVWAEARREVVPAIVALIVLAVLLIPQASTLSMFQEVAPSQVPLTDIGNLIGPLSWREVLGFWNNSDYRIVFAPAFSILVATVFVIALVLFGAFRLLRRRLVMIPAAAAVSMLIWWWVQRTQSPYLAAKALVIASPLVLLLAALALVAAREPDRGAGAGSSQPPRWSPEHPWPRARRLPIARVRGLRPAVIGLLAVALIGRIGLSSARALDHSTVDSSDHLLQLRTLARVIKPQPTLYLGDDDYIRFRLDGARVLFESVANPTALPLRAIKKWAPNESTIDFDSVTAFELNHFRWIISTRDAAGSAPPAGIRLVRTTTDFELWQRVSRVAPRDTLPGETWGPGAYLNCATPLGRHLARSRGVALVRAAPLRIAGGPVLRPAPLVVHLRLRPGRWDLEAEYVSPMALDIAVGRHRFSLPALLDRVGPRWPIGRIAVRTRSDVNVTIRETDTLLGYSPFTATVNYLFAVPVRPMRLMPLRDSCNRYVDWYRIGA